MKLIVRCFFIVFFIVPCLVAVIAQPVNDDCAGAIEIPNVSNWCSTGSPFNSFDATPSNVPAASCFGSVEKDVWYRFTAIAPNITITIDKHNTNLRPQAALYSGSCGNLTELACGDHLSSNDVTQVFSDNLVIGDTYYLRVQGRSNIANMFDMCFISAFPPVTGGTDCITSAILCNKNPFVHQLFEGDGNVPVELDDAPCVLDDDIPPPSERYSAWFKWTCDVSGTLTFTITPLKDDDDIDFVIYELTNGLESCDRTPPVRCEGANCDMPQTGLAEGFTATFEPPNCDVGQTQFLAPLDMVSGQEYVMVIHNFSGSNNGFLIEFGGTGTFLGPEAAFETDAGAELCINKPVQITDLTIGGNTGIRSVSWDFGEGANPATANTGGDKTVTYSTSGLKHILLTVESDNGCLDYHTVTIDIAEDCCPTNVSINANNNVTVDSGSTVNLNVTTNLPGNITYQWTGTDPIVCPTCQSTSIIANESQWVNISVQNEDGCRLTDSFFITVRFDTIIDTMDIDTTDIDTMDVEPVERFVFIPNIFSPNEDGINDGFTAYGDEELENIEFLRIYNRWGACIFERRNIDPNIERLGWDGTFKDRTVDVGVYVYVMGLLFSDGTVGHYHGSVTIMK